MEENDFLHKIEGDQEAGVVTWEFFDRRLELGEAIFGGILQTAGSVHRGVAGNSILVNLAGKDISADALDAVFPDEIGGIKKLLGI